ncbi:alpha/beta hydrolase [Amycolatopsis sp.]|uniref:alpha/beta hydrolase n=1 Tax=Amycolatopsis sp. TaxID=37632 RepID=UPI002E0C859C|nr:alpha/beta hydrolase-fold protein [Amycolatopsis sp.]
MNVATADPTLPGEITDRARQLGPLESPLIWWTLAGAAVILLAIMIGQWNNRRARRWTMSGAVLCLLLTVITGVNSYVGYVRTADDLGRLLERASGPVNGVGRLLDDGKDAADAPAAPIPARTDGARTEILNVADPANAVPSGRHYVLLPPGYYDPANAARHYPVVYLIHGYPFGGPDDWLTSGDAPGTLQALGSANLIAPMIVVSLDMTAGVPSKDWECLNVPGGPQLETYLAATVVPAIDTHYRTIANRAGRALGGMSGGGFGALNIGLHHVDEFSVLTIALPYDDLNDSVDVLHGDQTAIKADTPRAYIPTMAFTSPIATILAVGSGAPTDVTTARRIANSLQQRGQDAVVHVEQGFNHTWHTARAVLPYLLAFANTHFPQPNPG